MKSPLSQHQKDIKNMKIKILHCLAAALLLLGNQFAFSQEDFRKSAPQPGPAPRIELGTAAQFTLKNGLRVFVAENHKLPRISFQVFVDVPPFLEGEYAGYSDLAGQMLSRGTSTRTKAQIDEAVDFLGASLSSSASGLTGSSLTKHKEKLLTIMSDILLNPAFPEQEFEKIKKQTMSALAQAKDDPNAIAANVASVLRNGKAHPYGEVETEKSIANITVDKCKEYYSTYFKPNISYLVITGDITAKEARKLAETYFGKWKQGSVPKENYALPQIPEKTNVSFVDKTGAVQSVINITYPLEMKPGAPDAIKASVMNTFLGGYFGSRLMSNLREDKAYTYGARSSLDPNPVVANFNAYASVRNAVTDSAVVEFLKEMNRIRTGAIPEAELNMVKSVMTGNFARSLERPEAVARFALNTARFNLPADYYANYLENLGKVNAADITAMANKYILPDRAHILVVGNKDEVADKLKVFSADQKLNFYDAFGNPVEEAGLEVPAGVTAETVLSDYMAALGDPASVEAVQRSKVVMTASIQGMSMEMAIYRESPSRMAVVNSMMGSVMQQSVFDGSKGVNIQMGQKTAMAGGELEDMKVDALQFPEKEYKKLGVATELKGMELVNGKKAYKILVQYPSGSKKTVYFDAQSSLKIREIETEGEASIVSDYDDYKVVSGVKIPHSVVITGAAPFPLSLQATAVEINGSIDANLFKAE
jgi:predicted Zn-dependent peptidase